MPRSCPPTISATRRPGKESRAASVGSTLVDSESSMNVTPSTVPTFVLALPDSGPRIGAAFAETAVPPGGTTPRAARCAPDGSAIVSGAPSPGPSPAGEGGLAGVQQCGDLDEAVTRAFGWARPDGIVLLSPAAPSFGHFRDYRDRGDHFAAAMRALTGAGAVSPPP